MDFVDEENVNTDFGLPKTQMKDRKFIPWEGWWLQSTKKEKIALKISHMLIKSNRQIQGFCSIYKTHYKINGAVNKNLQIEFELLDYENTRIFIFRGEMQNFTLYGKFRKCQENDHKGIFELTFEKEHWKGFMQVKESKDEMELAMNVNQNGIYSLGNDENGLFVVEGNLDKVSKKCDFSLHYYQVNATSFYSGDWQVVNDQFIKIRGQWNIPKAVMGEFNLTGKMNSNYFEISDVKGSIYRSRDEDTKESGLTLGMTDDGRSDVMEASLNNKTRDLKGMNNFKKFSVRAKFNQRKSSI